jgi:hypothetical protein
MSRRRRGRWLASAAVAIALLAACSGPDTGDDNDPTPTATATTPATETVAPSPTLMATATVAASPTIEPTETLSSSPTAVGTATLSASPTHDLSDLSTELPELAELPAEGYIIAEEGSRTAQELANAYSDNAAHLDRLNEWGFKRHVFRSFSGPTDSADLPYLILTTVNEYGSPEQAEDALQWLKILGTTQGASEVDPPRVGDSAVALTLPTASGDATASIYVRNGAVVYVYFAEGGKPLPIVEAIAEKVFARR